MELILNNKTNEVIKVEQFEATFDIHNPEISYSFFMATNNFNDFNSFSYLHQYNEIKITSFKLYRDEQIVMQQNNLDGYLTGIREEHTNVGDYICASFNIYDPNYIPPTPIPDPDPNADPDSSTPAPDFNPITPDQEENNNSESNNNEELNSAPNTKGQVVEIE